VVERYIQVWVPDNGRVPFPSIITIWGGGTLWAINWRLGGRRSLAPHYTLTTAVTAAGGENEGGAEEQNAEDAAAAAAAAAGEDADNSNTNAGDKPSTTSGKSQLATSANQKCDILRISNLHSGSLRFCLFWYSKMRNWWLD